MGWTGRIGVLVALVGCRPAEPPSPPKPSNEDSRPTAPAEPTRLRVDDIVIVRPGTKYAMIPDPNEVCDRHGYPETLPAARAAELGRAAPGSPVTIVHPEGRTVARIVEAGCDEPTEDDEGGAWVAFDKPAGPVPAGLRELEKLALPPYLALVGAVAHDDARLVELAPFDVQQPGGERARRVLAEFALATAIAPQEDCEPRGRPGRAEIDDAVRQASVGRVQAAGQQVVFVVLEHPAITSTCEEDEPEIVAALLDLDTGAALLTLQSNNGIAPIWILDVDGDATQELLVEVAYKEDDARALALLYRGGEGWEETDLWLSPAP
jgi:hypothetical protein